MLEPLDGISVVIPCYNEENAIEEVLDQIEAAMRPSKLPYEIIAVNDGSTDKTGEKIDPNRFRLVEHDINRGYGATLKTGAAHARYNCIVITDADGTYPNERILELVAELEHYEMVVGARTGENVKIPLIRRPAKWALNQLANYLSGYKIPDINSGFRAIRKSLFDKYKNYFPNGFSLTTTITLTSLVNGHLVKYTPINYHHRVGQSKIKPIRDTMNFISLIVRTVLYFDPLRVCVPLALILFLLALLVGGGSFGFALYGHGKFMDVTTVLLILAGVQIFFIGALADLINKRMS